MNFNSTSNILFFGAMMTIISLFFIGLAIPGKHEIIILGYDTAFLILILGYILKKKYIQQLIGLSFYLVVFNLNFLESAPFQIQNEYILNFARCNTFYFMAISFLLLIPTLFNKYQFPPLTNKTYIKDQTIILTAIFLTILIQASIRLLV